MRNFFQSWRRRLGSVTLTIAMVLIVALGRSYFHEDHIWVAFSRQQALAVHTAVDHIAIGGEWQEQNGTLSITASGATVVEVMFDSSKCFNWVVYPADDRPEANPWDVMWWQWAFGTLGYGQRDGTLGFRLLAIPYWALVLPLTLLSAYLILRKPRTGVR